MSYHERPWAERYGQMGDTAEGVFADVRPLGAFQRLGWRRPEVKMKRMGERIRYMPDYYCESGYLVEVMGCGRDGVLKLRPEKWEGLKWWNTSGNPVALFVWNSAKRLYALISWDEAKRLVAKARAAGIETFPSDGNEYWPIRWDWVEQTSLVASPEGEAA